MKVLMFHSVGNERSNWCQNWLSVALTQFEVFCEFLKKKNYKTCLLDEWYYLQDHPQEQSVKHVFLTFDDGYLDNWIFVYPILKKYGLKGTIFINPEFVDPSKGLRSNLENVLNNRIGLDKIKTLGFLNWDEIQYLDGSGVLDIQSHSMSHNYYYCSDKIIDLYEGQDDYHWLAWIEKPERKPFWLTENQKDIVPKGYPVFQYDRALGSRRYFPDPRLIDMAVEFIKVKKSQDKKLLLDLLQHKVKEFPGVFETDEEMEQRFHYELFESKRILEEKLGRKVDFLCWPGGGYNDLSFALSKYSGYLASTLPSRLKNFENKQNNGIYKRIVRSGMGSSLIIQGKHYSFFNKKYLCELFKAKEGNLFALIQHKLKKTLMIHF